METTGLKHTEEEREDSQPYLVEWMFLNPTSVVSIVEGSDEDDVKNKVVREYGRTVEFNLIRPATKEELKEIDYHNKKYQQRLKLN